MAILDAPPLKLRSRPCSPPFATRARAVFFRRGPSERSGALGHFPNAALVGGLFPERLRLPPSGNAGAARLAALLTYACGRDRRHMSGRCWIARPRNEEPGFRQDRALFLWALLGLETSVIQRQCRRRQKALHRHLIKLWRSSAPSKHL